MNDQERALLDQFLEQLVRIRGVEKDPEADAMITRAFAHQPDAPYLAIQRALLLEQALNAAKAEIEQLRGVARPSSGGSFLGGNAWGSEPERPAVSVSGQPIPPNPVARAPVATAGQPSPWGSFLGQAAATAAGVAGGAFLFQGLENLFGWGHHDSGFATHSSQANLLNDEPYATHDDIDAQSITEDIDWDDFDGGGGDDSSLV
jgi:hypothetical protein